MLFQFTNGSTVSTFGQQYYCPFSFFLSLLEKRGREKKRKDSTKRGKLLFTIFVCLYILDKIAIDCSSYGSTVD